MSSTIEDEKKGKEERKDLKLMEQGIILRSLDSMREIKLNRKVCDQCTKKKRKLKKRA